VFADDYDDYFLQAEANVRSLRLTVEEEEPVSERNVAPVTRPTTTTLNVVNVVTKAWSLAGFRAIPAVPNKWITPDFQAVPAVPDS